MSADPKDNLHENEALAPAKEKAKKALRHLRKLAPDDFDEEMAAIKGGLNRAAAAVTGRKEQPAPDKPIPVDLAAKKSFLTSAASVTSLLVSAAFDGKKAPKAPAAKKAPRAPIFAEKPADTTVTEAAVKPKPAPAPAASETPRSAAPKVLTPERREAGKAVARTLGGGFSEAFRGVAAGSKAIRGAIEKKVPLAGAAFKAAGKAGGLAGDAARALGHGLKAAGTSAGKSLRDISDSGVVQDACKKIASSTAATVQSAAHKLKETSVHASEKAGAELKTLATERLRDAGKHTKEAAVKAYQGIADHAKKAAPLFEDAARKAGESVKRAAADAGAKLNQMKNAAAKPAAEKPSAEPTPAETTTSASADVQTPNPAPFAAKFKDLSAKAKERLNAVKNSAAEKAHDLAAEAKNTLGSLRDRIPTGEGTAAGKIKTFADSIQSGARDIADKTRSKLEHFITDETQHHDDK